MRESIYFNTIDARLRCEASPIITSRRRCSAPAHIVIATCHRRSRGGSVSHIGKLWVLAALFVLVNDGHRAYAAEADEVHISRQFGLPYIPLVIMEQKQLIEKHAKRLGVGELKLTWSTVGTTT